LRKRKIRKDIFYLNNKKEEKMNFIKIIAAISWINYGTVGYAIEPYIIEGSQKHLVGETVGYTFKGYSSQTNELIGTFDFKGEQNSKIYEIIGNVEPKFRGYDHGPKIRKLCVEKLKQLEPDIGIRSVVSIVNYPSLRYNLKAGMQPVGVDGYGTILFVDSPETLKKLGNSANTYKQNVKELQPQDAGYRTPQELIQGIKEVVAGCFMLDKRVQEIAHHYQLQTVSEYYKFVVEKTKECCGINLIGD
jgi:hypothetical protein